MGKKKRDTVAPSACEITGTPEDAFEMVNKYGTYEVQGTNGTENKYPQIGQEHR